MGTTNQSFPIYFNGYSGNGESMKKLAETILKNSNSIETFDFDKHKHLLSGNPYVLTK